MKFLDGQVDDYQPPDPTEALHEENRQLREDLRQARGDAARALHASAAALGALRKQLEPLYRALQAVFGELDEIGGTAVPDQWQARNAAIWQQWKTRLGPQCGKIIDALLLQPDMNTTQLAIAIGTRRQNVPSLIFKLNQAGLINKNGGKFSLKQL